MNRYDEFNVPDCDNVEDLIEMDESFYIGQWVEVLKGGDPVTDEAKKKSNRIGYKMFCKGFSNADVWKAYNSAREKCGLEQSQMPTKS